MECPLYNNIRTDHLLNYITNKYKNFQSLEDNLKFNWIFINEDLELQKCLGQFICYALDLRRSSKIINDVSNR